MLRSDNHGGKLQEMRRHASSTQDSSHSHSDLASGRLILIDDCLISPLLKAGQRFLIRPSAVANLLVSSGFQSYYYQAGLCWVSFYHSCENETLTLVLELLEQKLFSDI